MTVRAEEGILDIQPGLGIFGSGVLRRTFSPVTHLRCAGQSLLFSARFSQALPAIWIPCFTYRLSPEHPIAPSSRLFFFPLSFLLSHSQGTFIRVEWESKTISPIQKNSYSNAVWEMRMDNRACPRGTVFGQAPLLAALHFRHRPWRALAEDTSWMEMGKFWEVKPAEAASASKAFQYSCIIYLSRIHSIWTRSAR